MHFTKGQIVKVNKDAYEYWRGWYGKEYKLPTEYEEAKIISIDNEITCPILIEFFRNNERFICRVRIKDLTIV